jgi:hypothetical protein|tara:strand:+ start:6045 stop:6236 length:192 start_codon:yes stop_codon:yes gene_type:complete
MNTYRIRIWAFGYYGEFNINLNGEVDTPQINSNIVAYCRKNLIKFRKDRFRHISLCQVTWEKL